MFADFNIFNPLGPELSQKVSLFCLHSASATLIQACCHVIQVMDLAFGGFKVRLLVYDLLLTITRLVPTTSVACRSNLKKWS